MKRVRLRDLPMNALFYDANGATWRKGTEHGSHRNVYWATRPLDGAQDCFGGNTEFRAPERDPNADIHAFTWSDQ